jgi:hypothetical protein
MNMFRGLNPRFFYAIPILTMQLPFPSFLRCRAFLILEESRLNMSSASPTDTALHARGQTAPPSNTGLPSGHGNTNNRNNNRNRGKGKGKAPQQGGDTGGSSSGTAGTGGATAGHIAPLPAPATNPWTGMVHAWPMPWRPHAPGAGVLGPRPGAPPPFAGHAAQHPAPYQPSLAAPPQYQPVHAPAPAQQWDQAALVQALNNLSLQQHQAPPPPASEWYLDTGASSHMSNNSGMLSDISPSLSRIVVGNGSSMPVLHSGRLSIPTATHPLHLNDVLVSPSLIKNLLSVKRLCRDNSVTVEFDNLGFSVKDRRTRTVILRCNSVGDLYPVRVSPSATSLHAAAAVSVDVWHQRLGHPGRTTLARTLRQIAPSSVRSCSCAHLPCMSSRKKC